MNIIKLFLIFTILIISISQINGNTIICIPANNETLWTNPNTWSNFIIPTEQDFVILNNCDVFIDNTSNIVVDGISVQYAHLNILILQPYT